MVNNAERREPLVGPAAAPVLEARAERGLVALDEGRAWRRRHDGVLAVQRTEVYTSADDRAHRSAWRTAAEVALAETWRERWLERGRQPGWVEAAWVAAPTDLERWAADRVDWLHLVDHTDASTDDVVMAYEHVVVWLGRAQATLTIRHVEGLDLDEVVVSVATLLAATAPPPER